MRASLDANVAAVYAATGITDATQKAYVEYIIRKAKENSWWNLGHAWYGFVGGSSGSHAVNWKNPGTFNLTYGGGITHSPTGMVGDGVNGFADTGINANTLSLNSSSLVFYSRTNVAEAKLDLGTPTSANGIMMWIRWTDNIFYGRVNTTGDATAPMADARGLTIMTRTAVNDTRVLKNGAQIGTTSTLASTSLRNEVIRFFHRATGVYSTKECAFGGIAAGISPAIGALMYTDIQAGQTILSRQV